MVVCSRKRDDEEHSLAKHLQETCGCNARVMYIINPDGVSLTEIYGDVVDSKEIHTDVVVFVHDDVKFLRDGWGAELLRMFKEHEDYGIIGVAGSAEFNSEAAWWRNKKIYGQVLHRHDGQSWLSAYSPLLDKDLEEVCVVDGLFFAVCRPRLAHNFDKSFKGFNFYEIDLCLANFFSKKCKVGVTTNIRVAHESMGELKQNWYENRDLLNEKYKGKFPCHV